MNHGDQRFFQFEIIIKVLVSSFCFIWIPMLWVIIQIYSYSAGVYLSRQNLMFTDVRFWRLKSTPHSKGNITCRGRAICSTGDFSWCLSGRASNGPWNHPLIDNLVFSLDKTSVTSQESSQTLVKLMIYCNRYCNFYKLFSQWEVCSESLLTF